MIASGLRATVDSFDVDVGLGSVVTEDGSHRFDFHCTAIADGSRTIEVGAPVLIDTGPAGPGRWEAIGVRER